MLSVLASPAGADMVVYYRAGGWDAFSGPGENGKPVCGVGTTNPADSRSFSLRFQIGTDTVTFQAKKPTWNIPPGTLLPVVLQIGLDTPWNMQGVGNGQVVEWSLDRSTIQTFDVQFRRASSMTVTFPSGSEPPWTVTLNGSTAISSAFGRCVTDLTQREAAQPSPSTAQSGPGPTQPFSEPPPQPAAPR